MNKQLRRFFVPGKVYLASNYLALGKPGFGIDIPVTCLKSDKVNVRMIRMINGHKNVTWLEIKNHPFKRWTVDETEARCFRNDGFEICKYRKEPMPDAVG